MVGDIISCQRHQAETTVDNQKGRNSMKRSGTRFQLAVTKAGSKTAKGGVGALRLGDLAFPRTSAPVSACGLRK